MTTSTILSDKMTESTTTTVDRLEDRQNVDEAIEKLQKAIEDVTKQVQDLTIEMANETEARKKKQMQDGIAEARAKQIKQQN